jgi:hypothetical protein
VPAEAIVMAADAGGTPGHRANGSIGRRGVRYPEFLVCREAWSAM